MDKEQVDVERVIGFDAHPDSFTAAVLRGPTPAAAIVEKLFNKLPIGQLKNWAIKNTTGKDLIVLEASGNSFQIVRTFASIGRNALVLESCQLGKLKEAHANNDKISATRIAKAYLAGTSKVVWVPDARTQERRDWFHAYRKAVKRTTQMNNRIVSYLSDNGVRLKAGTTLSEEELRKSSSWTARQWQVLQGYLLELRHADEQREHWRTLIAQEVSSDPLLLSLVRLCGVRDMVAFAIGAIIGDIKRFSSPRKLVKYVGLNPAFDDSGEGQWKGGIGGHGRKDLRSLLIEAAQSIFRSKTETAAWGKKLLARKGSFNVAVAAVARKLVTAIWYLMMGKWTPLEEIDNRLRTKIGKIISNVGAEGLKHLGKTRKAFREELHESLKKGRVYQLDPSRKYEPRPKSNPPKPSTTVAQEYGVA
jgi:transposase